MMNYCQVLFFTLEDVPSHACVCARTRRKGFSGFLIYYEVIISTSSRACACVMGYKESCNTVTDEG